MAPHITAEAAMQRLEKALLDAKRTHDDGPDGGREAALMALAGVCEFIETVDAFRERDLVNPLVFLGVAIADLDRGAVAPMLQPRNLGRRAPDTHERRYIKAYAAATMDILMKIGLGRRHAAESVAGRLRHHGVSLAGEHREVAWNTVAGWRVELERAPGKDQAAVAYREMLAAHGERTAGLRCGIERGDVTRAQARDILLAGLSSVIDQTGEG